MKKKVFVIAPDFYGIDKSICRALGSFGFDIYLANTRRRFNLIEAASLASGKKIPMCKGIFNLPLRFFLEQDNKRYMSLIRSFKPDIVFIIKGETVFPETLRRIRSEFKIPIISYIWDCPFYSFAGRFADVYRKDNFANGMKLYDHIFVYDPHYVEAIKKLGSSSVSYLPLATDPSQYKPAALTDSDRRNYGYDVCFVGSPIINRIEVLDQLNEFNLGVFGEGWDKWFVKQFKKTPRYYKGNAAGDLVSKIYCASKIVLNIHDPEAMRGVNARTFDILACGAFQIVDNKPELKNLLKPGEEVIAYDGISDLKKLIRFYLNDTGKLGTVGLKGRQKVLSEHTWAHRMKELVRIIKEKGLIS